MPTIGGQFVRLAEAATRKGQSHVGYLEALLAAELEERESQNTPRDRMLLKPSGTSVHTCRAYRRGKGRLPQ